MPVTHVFTMHHLTNILLLILVGGMFLACSSAGEDDDKLPVNPTPSPGTDTTVIRDTISPDTLHPDTVSADTVVAPPDTTSTTGTDTTSTGRDTMQTTAISVKAAQQLYAGMAEDKVSVTGYVVGTAKGQTLNGKRLTGPWGVETNILLADTPNPTDNSELMPVELRKGTKARSALNLVANPTLHHRRVIITGHLRTYYRVAGLKSVSNYIILGEE